jgi:hypothetical protein
MTKNVGKAALLSPPIAGKGSCGKTCATGQEWVLSCGETVQGTLIVYNIIRLFPEFPR